MKKTIQEELQELEKTLSSLLENLKMASLDGDLSENYDWKILNEKREKLQRQIFELKLKKKILKMKDKTNNAKITFQLLETGEKKTIELTDEWNVNPEQGKISTTSPLGLALVEKKPGEISEVKTRTRTYKVQIINIIK